MEQLSIAAGEMPTCRRVAPLMLLHAIAGAAATAPPALPTWSTFVLGAMGDSCSAACGQSGGRTCVPHVQTNDSDAVFAKLGVVCHPGHAGDGSRNGTWWAADQPSYVAGPTDPRYQQCMGFKGVPAMVDCGAAVATTRRVCNCHAHEPGDGPVQSPLVQICNTTGLADGPVRERMSCPQTG
jgi:hypothetical protein